MVKKCLIDSLSVLFQVVWPAQAEPNLWLPPSLWHYVPQGKIHCTQGPCTQGPCTQGPTKNCRTFVNFACAKMLTVPRVRSQLTLLQNGVPFDLKQRAPAKYLRHPFRARFPGRKTCSSRFFLHTLDLDI